jgi:RNA processing factor Prp31
VQKAKKADRGRAARQLADKIFLAVRIDFFKGEFIADKLLKGLEAKFR